MKLLFEFNDTDKIQVGNDIDIDFNNGSVHHGEISFDDDGIWCPWDSVDYEKINWGLESFLVMCEEKNVEPKNGVHYFKANNQLYQVEIDSESVGYVKSIKKINK